MTMRSTIHAQIEIERDDEPMTVDIEATVIEYAASNFGSDGSGGDPPEYDIEIESVKCGDVDVELTEDELERAYKAIEEAS